MEQVTPDSLISSLGSLGAFAIVIWLYIKEKQDNIAIHRQKDDYIKELNTKVLQAFEKNAEVNTNLQKTIEENTTATQTLTQRVTDVLIKGNNHHG